MLWYQAHKIYLDCGYTLDDAKRLARLTAQVPTGSFYQRTSAIEKKIIESLKKLLPDSIKSYRFHDALIVSERDIVENNIIIPTIVDDYHFHVEVFNDGSNFMGPTTDVPYSSKHTIDNWHFC